MAKTKEISRRIKSITNTKKITRAMEMVAAAKMRKAIEAVLRTRTYANLSWETVLNLSKNTKNESKTYLHPLLTKREKIKKVAVILITSNKGMCGGYNSSVISKVKDSIKKHPDVPVEFILAGKKGEVIYNQNYKIAAEFPKSDLISEEEVEPIVNLAISDFLNKKYDKVFVAYTDFVNPVKQVPRMKQLLPVDIEAEDSYLGIVASPEVSIDKKMIEEKQKKHLGGVSSGHEYIFEPSPEEVLDKMIPRLLSVQIYQALLEANASEHSARMSAMHQATEAATDMVKELTLFYNKARQASITAEIAEISAGANALAD